MVKPSVSSPKNKAFQPVRFITLEQVLLIQTDQIDRYGGSYGLRDLAMLESAVFRGQATFAGRELYPSLFDKAAALMHSLILNHPFVDGNKRTAVVSVFVFMELNGIQARASHQAIISFALRIAAKKAKIKEISRWLKKHSGN